MEYKYCEDCFPQKEKPDDLINQIPKEIDSNLIQELYSDIDQIHNYDKIQSIDNISNVFQSLNTIINSFPSDKTDFLIQILVSSSLCSDCITYFQDMCQQENEIPYSYFELIGVIARKTTVFSDDQEYFIFVNSLINNFDHFIDEVKNLINTIIFNIIKKINDTEFLMEFYSSSEHEAILTIALEPENDLNRERIKNGAQIIIKCLYKNLINNCEDAELAESVLANFFEFIECGKYYNNRSNNEFIIITSSYIISDFPETYSVIYNDHYDYFKMLFSFLTVDNHLSFFAFQLITCIIRNFPREDPPDLDELINWESLLRFFNEKNGRLEKMLVFSASYLKFGSAFFFKFSECGFFDRLLEEMLNNTLKFKTYLVAANCLVNAIIFSGADTQIFELFQKGALPALLFVLENDSNEELTEGILNSIECIWNACENQIEDIPETAVDDFTSCFSDEDGYQILMSLKTCVDKAQSLCHIIGDPPL